MRKKNRKLRRLRELYPDIRIKLFYARDFRMLLLKFGRMALIDELTGTTGQSTPPRAVAVAPEPVEAAPDAGPAGLDRTVDAGAGDRGRRAGQRPGRPGIAGQAAGPPSPPAGWLSESGGLDHRAGRRSARPASAIRAEARSSVVSA